jgi:serine/threonine-protein kinase
MPTPLKLGRYSLFAELASGGMATVYLGRMNGELGFGRTVAIKRMHPHTAREPEFVSMFLDEARVAARIQHPNVVATLDIVDSDNELFLVMEYVHGASLSALLRAARNMGADVPIANVVSIAIGCLNGLHAAHEAKDEHGRPLGIVHRDVSPQNVLVGADGVARLLDFGVARAAMRIVSTREGQLKGKLRYMAPEQVTGEVSRKSDIYSAGVVLWEALTRQRLFSGDTQAQLLSNVLQSAVPPPSRFNREISAQMDGVVLKALARDARDRWDTAFEMAHALDETLRPASSMTVSEWVQRVAGPALQKKAELVAQAESAVDLSDTVPGEVDAGLRLSGRLPQIGASDSNSDSAPLPAFFTMRSWLFGSGRGSASRSTTALDLPSAMRRASRLDIGRRRMVRYVSLGVGAVAVAAAFVLLATHAARREASVSLPSGDGSSAAVALAASTRAGASSATASAASETDGVASTPDAGRVVAASVPASPSTTSAARAAHTWTAGARKVSDAERSATAKPTESVDLKRILNTR